MLVTLGICLCFNVPRCFDLMEVNLWNASHLEPVLGPVRSCHDCKSLLLSTEMLAEVGWNAGGSWERGNMFSLGLGVLQLWLDGSKLEAKMARDLERVKCS